jgi:PIN domain nuclease of toxin-antitoxin system
MAEHAAAAGQLPMHHRDPFDRMIIAQAIAEELTVVTPDEKFPLYDIEVMDC